MGYKSGQGWGAKKVETLLPSGFALNPDNCLFVFLNSAYLLGVDQERCWKHLEGGAGYRLYFWAKLLGPRRRNGLLL